MRWKLAAPICIVLFASLTRAAPTPPSTAETKQLLQGNQFDTLDDRYGDIQSAYRKGKITDVDLRAAFRAFYDPDPALEKSFDAWVKHSPRVYVAHLARGIYFKIVGSNRRGSAFASKTTAAQFDGMRAAYDVAEREFEISLELEKKPLLTYLYAMDAVRDDDDVDIKRKFLDAAIAIDPSNFIVREKYMGF